MKRIAPLFLTGLLAMGLVSCKKGSIAGQVIDPFSGQPVGNSTVWLEGTPYQVKSADGSFKFEKLEPGEYKVNAGKNKCSKTQESVSVTEQALNATKNVFIFSRQDYEPGLYSSNNGKFEKVANLWQNWEASCKESILGYRLSFADLKTKKQLELPAAAKLASDLKILIYQPGAESLIAKSIPVSESPITKHTDCKGFEKKETKGLFVDMAGAKDLKSEYRSEQLFEVTGTLPKGKQVIAFFEGPKLVKSYLVEVK